MGAIYIMWIRQLKKYWRSKPRMIASLSQPLLFLVALGFGFGPIFQKAGGGNYIEFLAPGVIAMSILFTSVFTGIEVIWERQFGFLKETLVAPVPRWKIMFGKTIGGATVAMSQGIVVFLITLLIGFRVSNVAMIPVALIFMFLTAMLFTALGIAIASRLTDMQAFPLIINFLIMPLFFLSGALFPLEGLPAAISSIAAVNPLSYGVDGLRATLTSTAHMGVGVDLLVSAVVALIILGIGTWMFSKTEI
jgi:ABC-2 type transport system permease protein